MQIITTQYLDRHNDYLQIYVRRVNGGYVLTDDGYILGDSRQSGYDIAAEKGADFINRIIKKFNVKLKGDDIFVEASDESFLNKKDCLIRAMLEIYWG